MTRGGHNAALTEASAFVVGASERGKGGRRADDAPTWSSRRPLGPPRKEKRAVGGDLICRMENDWIVVHPQPLPSVPLKRKGARAPGC